MTLCPCSFQMPYADCCQPYHMSKAYPPTAKVLMQSRFSAFYFKHIDYIISTTVPAQQGLLDKDTLQAWADNTNWIRLDVISHHHVGKRHAQVHFCAYFESEQGESVHDERSAFVQIEDRWYFLDPTVPIILTNKQPCLCGSGEKFKVCCGRFL